MRIEIGTKVTTPMPGGLLWPAVVVGELTAEDVTVTDRNTGQPVDIIVTRFDAISLRTNRAGETYLAFSNEVERYGYRTVALPRFSNVDGLDVDSETGEKISLDGLMERHLASYGKWLTDQNAARVAAVDAADL